MTDMPTRTDLTIDDDLELLTRYLNRQLDPERVAQVRRRLDVDPAFRDFAAPVLLAWRAPPRWQREPVPAGDLERHWDKFTKKADFLHHRRKRNRRRLWFLAIFIVAVALPALLYGREIRTAFRDWRDFKAVRHDTGWIAIREGHQVRLDPGTRLRSSDRQVDGIYSARLEGAAHVRVQHPDTGGMMPGILPLSVETRAGVASTGMGEFRVRTSGDSTYVEVLRPVDRRFVGPVPIPTFVLVYTHADPNPIQLHETQRALLLRNGKVTRLPGESRDP
jgi:hypothetical protein